MEELNNMIAQPGATAFVAVMVWGVALFLLRSILSDLLKMHKSKSSVKN